MNRRSPQPEFIRRGFAPALLALCLTASFTVRAHDMFEITATAKLNPGDVVLEVAMARGTAMAACAREGKKVPAFEAEDFAEVRELFEARAGLVLALTAGGEGLAVREAQATLTGENDVEFRIVYPRPARGPLAFDAVCLKTLPDQGYGVTLTALDMAPDAARVLAHVTLMADEPTIEINWPPKPAVVAAAPVRAGRKVPVLPFIASAAALVAAGAGIGWARSRKRRTA